MHLARDQQDPVPERFPVFFQCLRDRPVGHSYPRIPGEHNKIRTHCNCFLGVFQRSGPAGGQFPFAVRTDRTFHAVFQRLQINPHSPARKPLDFADHVFRRRIRKSLDHRSIDVKQVQYDEIRSHGRGEFRIGHIPQHGTDRSDRLADQKPSFASRNRVRQLFSIHPANL